MTKDESIKLLLNLLSYSTPYSHEKGFYEPFLPKGGVWDEQNNYIITQGNKSESLFACHLDTVGGKAVEIKPELDGGFIFTDNPGIVCLGGDDKCGVLCLMAMIEANIPGTYIFHSGEECGGIGAANILDTTDLSLFKRAIEFDRLGTSSIITAMGGGIRCASDEFALTLAKSLGGEFAPDPTGLYTDVFDYKHLIPECVNLSVGYYNGHTKNEIIDAKWLIDEFIPKIISIDWESLPVFRSHLDEEEYLFNDDFDLYDMSDYPDSLEYLEKQ